MRGHTSVAPILGCSPVCLLISINSEAFLIARNAALMTFSGSPTNVTTVLFVASPGSILNNFTPSTNLIWLVMLSMTVLSLPFEKLGTHSMICFFIINLL